MPMKTIEGYSKEKYTNTSVLLAGGGAKALSDFIGSLSWDSTNKKIKYTPVGGSATDLVTLSWDNIANKPTSLPANGGNADTSNRTKFLETFHQNSTTNTYGSQYPIWAQWSDSTNVRLKCTNYTVWTDKANYASNAGNADKLDDIDSTGFYRFSHISNLQNKDLNYANNQYGTWNYGDDNTQKNTPTTTYGCYLSWGDLASSDTSTTRNQTAQIGINCWNDLGRMYVRARQAGNRDVTSIGSWRTVAFTSDIPSVGNGTVTVTQAGSTIGSFTMNQSGNTLIALNDTNTNYYPIRSYTTGLQISSYSGSADCALFVPYATDKVAGVVSTAVQSFAGQKTFLNGIKVGSTRDDQSTDNTKIYFGDNKFVWIGESPQDDALMLNCGTGKNIYFSFAGNTAVTSSNYSTYAKIYMSNSGAVYASSGFYESSDERLKKVVDTIKVNLDDLAKLRKIYYLWNNTPEDGRQLGMIAQDVQKLYPELVSVDKETGYLSLAYDKLSVIALEAIDTLYEEYKQLKEHVNGLEKLLHSKEIL